MSDEFKDIDESEIDKLVSEDDASQKELMHLVNKQRRVIDGMLDAQISGDENQDEVRTKARAFALQHLSTALSTIAELVTGADKDTTRLAAARTIWAIASATSIKDDNDPLARMFAAIEKSNDSN